MDAHLFRHIGTVLAGYLHNARLERIHQPLPHLTVFSLFTAGGSKECLVLRADRKDPLVFLVPKNPFQNPSFPPALVMRLRKYCEGRRIMQARLDWPTRRLAFAVPGEGGREAERPAGWLLLDLKTGPDFVTALPDDFGLQPQWPSLSGPGDFSAEDWRQYQVLTPALRRTLAVLDDADKAALLVDLESGGGDLFVYTRNAAPPLLCAWPLPPALRPAGSTEQTLPADNTDLFTLLRDAQFPLLVDAADSARQKETDKPEQATQKRRARLAAKLREEQSRLLTLFARREDALLLQANLWRFAPEACQDSVTLDGRTVALNPFLTLSENMQALFKQSARAERGLAMLEKRLALLETAPQTEAALFPKPRQRAAQNPSPDKNTALAGMQEFVSSDGFTLWRGRNAEGNRRALKLANPFDLWFHVEDGPSAHLILRRNHAAQEVPERTLHEAAALTALKSRHKDDSKAPVMAALAKHVSPIKGAAPGTVRVHTVWRTFMAAPDPELETRLAAKKTDAPTARHSPQ